MKLTFEEIKNVTFGALSVTETEKGIRFLRSTEKQIDAWTDLYIDLGERSRVPTGVCLDFHTNSRSIAFDALSGKFEILVNGMQAAKYVMEELHEKGESARLAITGGESNRITIIFPSHNAEGILRYVELDDGSLTARHEYDMKLLFIGDSITQGWASQYDSLSFAWRTASFFNAEMLNQGIGGAYYHESTFDKLDFDPDIVVIAYGTNDVGRYATVEEMQDHARKFLDLIKAEYEGRKAKVVILSPIHRLDLTGVWQEKYLACCAAVKNEADAHKFIFIDGHELVPANKSFFASDGLHPNDLGFGLYAENLIKKLTKII
ncbi:MAG: SGNH/GDSL hydrolase family protein [Ruminococcaceae bacterium]|nr:SGNH/GDSL hydrolase family protein [Oscillospiraceae bacterium]